jgi:hypothetical protein
MEVQMGESNIWEHATTFIQATIGELGWASVDEVQRVLAAPPIPLDPVVIEDVAALTDAEIAAITANYYGPFGVAGFVVLNPPMLSTTRAHPLFTIADQLNGSINLDFPLEHPLENHPLTIDEFDGVDHTVKVRDVPKEGGYREQGETSEQFDTHHDGMGSAGTVDTVFLYMDGAPVYGGYTYFQNLPRIALGLALADMPAFVSLFAPDAVTLLRPRGKGRFEYKVQFCF